MVKLVVHEAETEALTEWLRERPGRVSSVLGAVEVLRAARRAAAAADSREVVELATDVVASVAIVALSAEVAETAGALEPLGLRTLDAIHLATAIVAGPFEAFVAYDEKLVAAARAAGLAVAQPGR